MTTICCGKRSGRLRVLLLVPNPRLALQTNYVPGEQPNPFDFWQILAQHGVDVDIMDPTPWPLNPLARWHSFYRSLDPYRALKVLLYRRDYDLLISAGDGSAALPILLRRLFRFKTPILIWDLSPATRWRLRKRIQDYVLPRLTAVIAINSGQVRHIAERCGPGVQVVVSGYAIDTAFYRPWDCGLEPYLLAVGDDPGRDFPTLLDAIDDLDVKLVIKTRAALPMNRRRDQYVRQIADRLDYPAFRELYGRCRFVILPLKPDTLNASGVTTLAEAFSMGKAVIVSSSDGIRDFLLPDENCIVVPAGDPNALRAAIVRLLREPETCERLGRNARRFAEGHCSKTVLAERLAMMLRSYVAKDLACQC
jgi:glycosyltransferase involved in cell wall biosynthesis